MLHIILKTIVLFLLSVSIAHAYLGPGIGGGVIAATVGIIIAIFASIFDLIWFPVKRFLNKKKDKKKETD